MSSGSFRRDTSSGTCEASDCKEGIKVRVRGGEVDGSREGWGGGVEKSIENIEKL